MKNGITVGELIRQFRADGWSLAQAKSLAWLEFFEAKSAMIEGKYQGNVIDPFRMECFCRDCKEVRDFSAHGSVRDWIGAHKGHSTKTIYRGSRG